MFVFKKLNFLSIFENEQFFFTNKLIKVLLSKHSYLNQIKKIKLKFSLIFVNKLLNFL